MVVLPRQKMRDLTSIFMNINGFVKSLRKPHVLRVRSIFEALRAVPSTMIEGFETNL